MSIQTEITRLQNLTDRLETKLVSMQAVQSGAKLQECVEAVENVADNGAVTGTISNIAESYKIPGGYHNGEGNVQILATEKSKIVPGNIKSGVTILGVTGGYAGEGVSLQEKSVTPTKAAQKVAPDEGYDGLSAVNVGAIPSNYGDISGVTATAADVLANKTFVDSTGKSTAGTMLNNGAVAATIDGLAAMSYTIPKGYHDGKGTVTLTNDIETLLSAI